MAVDAPAVRKDLFDLVRMFGPANAGGPAQSNTNPGASQAQPAQLPPPPPPGAMNAAPEPQGVKVLPQGTEIQPNTGVLDKPTQPKVAQPGSPQQGPIELLPGDADPNLLPPEIRDSWMFRYQQAQRAAAYKQAEEQARWGNIVGGIGNIAQIATGGRPTNQTGLRAEEPKATDVGTLYGWKKDYDTAQQAASAKAKYENLVGRLQKERPDLSPAAIEAIALDKDKLAQYGFNQADAKAIAEAAQAQIKVVKDTQGLAGANINDPKVIAESAKLLGVSEDYVRSMPIDVRLETAKSIATSQVQGQGAPGKGFTEAHVKDTITHIERADKARDQMTPTQQALRTIQDPTNKLWQGGFYGDPTIQGGARMLTNLLGQDLTGITNADELRSRVGQIVMDNAKAFGGQPTEGERQAIKEVVGADGRINRAALETIMRDNLRRQVQAQITAQDKVTQAADVFKDDPRSQAYLRSAQERLAQVPDMTREMFGEPVVQGLIAQQSTPEAAAATAAFDKRWGRGMAAYVLAKRGAPANAGQ